MHCRHTNANLKSYNQPEAIENRKLLVFDEFHMTARSVWISCRVEHQRAYT